MSDRGVPADGRSLTADGRAVSRGGVLYPTLTDEFYAASYGGTFYSSDYNGNTNWSDTNIGGGAGGIDSTFATDRLLLASINDSTLYYIDISNNSLNTLDSSGNNEKIVRVGPNGEALAASDSTFYKYPDPTDLSTYSSFSHSIDNVGHTPTGVISIARNGELFMTGFNDDTIEHIDYVNMQSLGTYNAGQNFYGIEYDYERDVLLAQNTNGYLYKFDSNLNLLASNQWTTDAGNRGSFVSVGRNGLCYAGTQNGRVAQINISDLSVNSTASYNHGEAGAHSYFVRDGQLDSVSGDFVLVENSDGADDVVRVDASNISNQTVLFSSTDYTDICSNIPVHKVKGHPDYGGN